MDSMTGLEPAGVWAIGGRTSNYEFNSRDLSINQVWSVL